MRDIDLLAEMPAGNGPKREHVRLRMDLARIARRVAMKALASGREDILLEVYAAGLMHATVLAAHPTQENNHAE